MTAVHSSRVRLVLSLAVSLTLSATLHVVGWGFTLVDVASGILAADTLTDWIASGRPPQHPTPQHPDPERPPT